MIDSEASYCSVGPSTDPEHTYVLDEGGKKVDVGVKRAFRGRFSSRPPR